MRTVLGDLGRLFGRMPVHYWGQRAPLPPPESNAAAAARQIPWNLKRGAGLAPSGR